MVRVAISQPAFKAIVKSLPVGSVGYENKVNARGERLIWLERSVVDRLRYLRGPGESYSEVILRLAPPPRPRRRWPRSTPTSPAISFPPQVVDGPR
jgi:hypothetical protein